MEVTPEVVGDVVRFRNAEAVAWDKDTQELIVQVSPSGYRIAVPRQELDHSTRVWSMGQRKGTLAVRRGWWEAVGHPPLAQEHINGVSASMARHGGASVPPVPVPVEKPSPMHSQGADFSRIETRTYEDIDAHDARAIYDKNGVRIAEFAANGLKGAVKHHEDQAARVRRFYAEAWNRQRKFNESVYEGENLPAARIVLECDRIEKMLLAKNRQYGDSALNPVRVFSHAGTVEQIKVRIDDKISRMQTMDPSDTEDVVDDLIGYLILLKVAQRRATAPQPSAR